MLSIRFKSHAVSAVEAVTLCTAACTLFVGAQWQRETTATMRESISAVKV